MQHYWGAEQLQARMGLKSYSGLQGLIAREHLPVYRRVKKIPGDRPRRVLYSNELLLTTWELAQARLEAERMQGYRDKKNQSRRDARQAARGESASASPAVDPATPQPAPLSQVVSKPNHRPYYQYAKQRSREPQT